MISWTVSSPFGEGGAGNGCEIGADGSMLVVGYNADSSAQAALSTDQGVSWTVTATPPLGAGGYGAGCAIAGDGRLLVVGSDISSVAKFASSDDLGATWAVSEPFGGSGLSAAGVAIGPDDSILVAGGDNAFTKQAAVSTDGGLTWTTTGPLFLPGQGGLALGCDIGPDGTMLLVGFSVIAGSPCVCVSTDGGTSWTNYSPFGTPNGEGVGCGIGPDGAMLVGGFNTFDSQAGVSTDNGGSFTVTVPFGAGGVGSDGAFFPSGMLLSGWDNDSTVQAATSTDGGSSWETSSPFGEGGYGNGCAVGSDGTLLVAGNDAANSLQAAVASPPIPPRVRTFVGAPWRIIVTDIEGRTLSDLDRKATGRQFLFALNGPADHIGQVASDDPEVNIPFPDADSPAVMTHNRRLLYALRYEAGADPPYVCRFGGIITNFEDQGADAPTSRYTAYDPWQLLMARPCRGPGTDLALPGDEGITFPAGTRASDIAGFFLEATEVVDGETHIDTSDSSLIEDTDPLTEPITFEAGLSVGEAWQQLVATGTIDIYLPPMYEPITAPGKVVRFQTAKRLGATRFNIVMGWDKAGRSLQGVNRQVDGTRLANRVKYWAGNQPAPLQSNAASISAYGEWWAQQFFPGEANIGLVELMALAELLIRRNGARSVNLDPAPERTELVLRDWGLGDYLPVWASPNLREPLGIDYDTFDPDFPGASGYHRVFAIPVELDDNGVELTRGVATAAESASA